MTGAPLSGAYDGYITCFDYRGRVKWRQYCELIPNGVPAIGDLDGDGFPEVVVGSYFEDYRSLIYCLDGRTGQEKKGWPKEIAENTPSFTLGSPTLADLDGDGLTDIVMAGQSAISQNGFLFILNYRGDFLFKSPFHFYPFDLSNRSFSLADLDGDGMWELAVQGANSYTCRLWVFDLDTPVDNRHTLWPQYGHDAHHTCNADYHDDTLIKTPALGFLGIMMLPLLLASFLHRGHRGKT